MSSDQSFKALQSIWDRVAKPGKDGKKVITFGSREDLVYLYSSGFVDERHYTLKDWIKSFDDSLQKDGSYAIAEAQWLDKVKYHYTGPIGLPFLAASMREGDWPEAEMEKLIREKILPAVYFTEAEFRRVWNEVRPTFFANGVYKIAAAVKKDLQEWMDLIPSPAQIRALGVAEARRQKSPGVSQPNSSGFSKGPTQSELAANRLASLLSKK